MKECRQCHLTKNDDQYYAPKYRICKTCIRQNRRLARQQNPTKYREYDKKRYIKNAEYRREYQRKRRTGWYRWMSHIGIPLKCCRCAYNKCTAALDFHHIRDKRFGISQFMSSKSLSDENKDSLLEELRNCLVLCANCHREEHDKNTGDYLEPLCDV